MEQYFFTVSARFVLSNNTSRGGRNEAFLACVHPPINAIVLLVVDGLVGAHPFTGMPEGKILAVTITHFRDKKKAAKRINRVNVS